MQVNKIDKQERSKNDVAMNVYILKGDAGSYDDAREWIIGVYDSYEKTANKKREVEIEVSSSLSLRIDDNDHSEEMHELRMKKYYAGEFNGCTIYTHLVE